jgi:very-short-patch-repair endonuclease
MRSPTRTRERAKALRRVLSPPEAILWAKLRTRHPDQPTIRRQHPIGPYIADFYCAAARLVIEIDGAIHGVETQYEHDRRRDAVMERMGYRVVRYPASAVLADADEVARSIFDAVTAIASERGR